MKLILLLFLVSSNAFFSQTYENQIREQRTNKFNELKDTANHILTYEEAGNLISLDYYEIDRDFAVLAKFTKDKGKKFKMPTTTERKPVYRRYGYLEFKINDTLVKLTVYQNLDLKKNKTYKNYLFLPFRDNTSSVTTYGGGRYIDLETPEGDTVLIDFNLSYNPYCTYSYRYSCPIPPGENTINVSILAGEKIPLMSHE